MKVVVIAQHVSVYPDPVGFRAGDTVSPTQRRDDEFPGWIWIRTADGKEGWAPEEHLEIGDGDSAVATTDYTARELNTKIGETLESEVELKGWLWCRNGDGCEGWIPANTTRPA